MSLRIGVCETRGGGGIYIKNTKTRSHCGTRAGQKILGRQQSEFTGSSSSEFSQGSSNRQIKIKKGLLILVPHAIQENCVNATLRGKTNTRKKKRIATKRRRKKKNAFLFSFSDVVP